MNRNYYLNRYYRLKAILKGKNQEIKRLKRVARETKEEHAEKIEDFNRLLNITINELEGTQEELKECKRKKWYQFIPIQK